MARSEALSASQPFGPLAITRVGGRFWLVMLVFLLSGGSSLSVTDDHPRVELFLGSRADGGPRHNINRGFDSRR